MEGLTNAPVRHPNQHAAQKGQGFKADLQHMPFVDSAVFADSVSKVEYYTGIVITIKSEFMPK